MRWGARALAVAVAAIFGSAFPSEVAAHGKHDRLHEVDARTWITVEPLRIALTHEQTFTSGMSRFVCTEIDKNADTRLAPAEIDAWAKGLATQIAKRCPLHVDWQTVAPRTIAQSVRGVPATVPLTDTAATPIVLRLDATYPLEVGPGGHVLELVLGTINAYQSRTDLAFVAPVRAIGAHAGELSPAGDRIANYVQLDGQPPTVGCVFETGNPATTPGVRPEAASLLAVTLFALGLAAGRRRALREQG